MKVAAVLASLVLFSANGAFAQGNSAGPGGAGMEAHKQEVLAHMDKRITALQEAKSCISAAADQESMKKCHESLKEDRMAMRHEHMDKKIQRADARKAKLEMKKMEMEKKSSNP